jgi:hypothetical protein
MASPFAPRHGDVDILAHVIVDGLVKPEGQSVLPYEILSKAVGYDVRVGQGYTRCLAARRLVWKEHQRIVVPAQGDNLGKGLIALTDSQVVSRATKKRLSAAKAARRARAELACVDFSALTPEDQVAHNSEAALLGLVQEVCSNKGAKKIYELVSSTKQLLSSRKAIEALFAS